MCRHIEFTLGTGIVEIAPVDCDDGGLHCRDLSRPYVQALGDVRSDVDALNGSSHVVACDVVFKDLQSLAKAGEACGLEFREGQTTWKWYGRWMKDYHAVDAAYKNGISPAEYGMCEHALTVKGSSTAYEIGVKKNPKGPGYVLVYDFYGGPGGQLRAKIGQNAAKLQQEYQKAVIAKTAVKQRATLGTPQVLPDGRIKIKARIPRR